MGQNNSNNSESEKTELMKIHNKRRRHVVGCMACAKEIHPLTTFEEKKDEEESREGWGYVCGTCREAYWYCKNCISSLKKREDGMIEHKPDHVLSKEPVDLQVDVSNIRSACDPSSSYSAAVAVRACFETYKRRWLLGERIEEGREEFSWQSYSSVYEEAKAAFFGCSDLHGLKSNVPGDANFLENKEEEKDHYCILVGAASRLWYVCYFSLVMHGVPIVPMPGTTTPEQLKYVTEKVRPRVIFISKNVEIHEVDCSLFKDVGIVWLEDSPLRYHHLLSKKKKIEEEKTEEDLEKNRQILWNELISHGRKIQEEKKKNNEAEKKSSTSSKIVYDPNSTRILLSSSGTTGLPKLIILTDEMLKQNCTPPTQGIPTIMLSIQPLRQAFDLVAKGGRIGIFTSISHISSDLKLVRPTIFGSTPAFFLSLYEQFKVELRDRKLNLQQQNESVQLTDVEEDDIRRKLSKEWSERGCLGNRCRVVIIGGAKSSKELRKFIFDSLGAVVIDGYGTTETGAVSSSGKVLQDVKLILVDSPEFGYMTSDEPYPRGEIVVNTPRMTKGYFGDPEATAKQFVNIGGVQYSRTGDIGRMKDGKVEVIDRVKSLFKLRNGVFVAPAPIECVLENSAFVNRVFVWGNSTMASVVAAVTIGEKKENEEENEGEEDVEEKEEDEEDDEALRKKIKGDFARLARIHYLKSGLVPNVIVIDKEQWSEESGLVNSAGKPVRSALLKKYRDEFTSSASVGVGENNQMEEEVDDSSKKVVLEVKHDSDLLSGFVKLIVDSIPDFDLQMTLSSNTVIYDLGADSLAFARIVGQIRKKFSSNLTLPQLMQCETLGHVQRACFGDFDNSTDSYGDNESAGFWNKEVDDALEELSKLCDDKNKYKITDQRNVPQTVLLTGGRGFVGVFILSELCKRGSRVICLIRRRRCDQSSPSSSSISKALENFDLPQHEGKWGVIEGDISKVGFGIREGEFSEVSMQIGGSEYPQVIIHCAAAVGSANPYKALRPHNVGGTIHSLALAHHYGSRFVHISTVGFLPPGLSDLNQVEIPPDTLSHLGSYAQSKWVAERVVLTNKKLPQGMISIVRVGTCFGARKSGAGNAKDSVIRLIAGLCREKVYCSGTGSPLPSMFRLVPVDWVAEKTIDDSVDISPEGKIRISCAMTLRETPLEEIIKALDSCGVKLENVSPSVFRERMKKIIDEEDTMHPLFVYASTLASSGFASDNDEEGKKEKDEDLGKVENTPPPDLVATIKWMIQQGFIEK